MKKLVNDPANFVRDMMEGIYLANQDKLKWVPEYNIFYRADMPKNKVLIMQGSGSGHEPAHSMIVGQGMLDACCRAMYLPLHRWTMFTNVPNCLITTRA